MKVILIAGNAGSGKTSLGKEIVELAKTKNLRALQTEFSKYIKMYTKEILNITENKPRKFLQDMGEYIRKDLNDTYFFTRRMLEDLRIYEKYFDIVVISDVRLLIELEELIDSIYDVTTILVKNEFAKNDLTEAEKNHITENEFRKYLDYDYIVDNKNNNILLNAAKTIVEELK